MYGFDILRDGLRVYTTLDSRMQRYANGAVDEHLTRFQERFNESWDWKKYPDILHENVDKMIKDLDVYKKAKTPAIRDSIVNALRTNVQFVDSVKQAARTIEVGMVVIDPHTGHVKALVGGRNYRTFRYGLNHVTQIRRQPGSAFKPFVYIAAFEAGYDNDSRVFDGPVSIKGWQPANYEGKYYGDVTLREAFARSLNSVAAQLTQQVGVERVIEAARRLGIVSDLVPAPSLALGTSEVNLLELTGAYAVLANRGVGVLPYAITEVRDAQGTLLYAREGSGLARLLAPRTILAMQDAMTAVIDWGTGKAARIGRPAAGKTGTAQDYRDAWFVGFTAELVTGIWVGNDDRRPMKQVVGGGLPARLWHDFMLAALEGEPAEPLPWPGNPAEPVIASATNPAPAANSSESMPVEPEAAEEAQSDPLTALIEAIVGGQPAERK
jgi:penicillin-binding protein 1A